jgi:hypothetical protein
MGVEMTQARATRHPEPDDDLPPLPAKRTVPQVPDDAIPELDEVDAPAVPPDDIPQLPERLEQIDDEGDQAPRARRP